MKKITAIIVAVLCLITLAGSSGAEENKAIKTAENFMDALISLDAESAAKYIDDGGELVETIGQLSGEAIMESIPPEIMGDYADEYKAVVDEFITKVKEKQSYEITGAEQDGEGYIVSVKFSDVDFAGDFATIFDNTFNDDILSRLVMKLYEMGEINENSSETEIAEAMAPALVEMLREAYNKIELETSEKAVVLHIAEIDGEWKICAEKSLFE